MNQMPTFDQLMQPLFTAIKLLGGSGSIDEIDEKTAELLNLPDEVINIPHNPGKSNTTEFRYRLAWARTYLKQYGLIENSSRGVWTICPNRRQHDKIVPQEIVRVVREAHRAQRAARLADESEISEDDDVPDEVRSWRENLHDVLTKIDPAAFERLTQRLLRESGFIHVEVTGKSGDGGIDGKGIARVNGMLSFHVIFQCKRYQGTVSASHVRDFRGG